MEKQGKLYDPTICVTHNCNLNCVYCYQKYKGSASMSFETAKACVDEIFKTFQSNVYSGILLKFSVIYDYERKQALGMTAYQDFARQLAEGNLRNANDGYMFAENISLY